MNAARYAVTLVNSVVSRVRVEMADEHSDPHKVLDDVLARLTVVAAMLEAEAEGAAAAATMTAVAEPGATVIQTAGDIYGG